MKTSQVENKEGNHAQGGNGNSKRLKIVEFEHIHPVRDNGYQYDLIEKRYKIIIEDNGETFFDNDGRGFFSENEAFEWIYQNSEQYKENNMKERDEKVVDQIDYQELEIPDDYDVEKLQKDTDSFNKYSMTLTPLEYYRYRVFEKNHMHKDVNKGAIGGHIGMNLCFTSIGVGKSAHCSICEADENITDYNW